MNTHLALVALLLASTPAMAQTADRIWSGGPILTLNDKAMRAEAIAEAGGRIIAVGSKAEVMNTRGPKTQLINLNRRTMVPGFVDAHGHIVNGGLQALSANLLAPPDGKVQDIASLLQTLRDWRAANADAVSKTGLILGSGYDNAQLKEQRHPTREELDSISPDLPVLVLHQSGHLATVNSAFLKLMNVDANTKDPEGGVIQRKPGTTEPNGTLEETALFGAVPVVFKRIGPEGLKTFAREGAKLWARFGYTTAEEGRSIPATADLMKAVAAEGGFDIDVNTYLDVLVDRDYIKKNQSAAYVNRYRVAGAKLSIDATVTRRARGSGRILGPDQRVDVITALKAMSLWPAYHHFEETSKGSLEVGKLADFAILSKDPTAVKPETIADIKVTETIKEGKTIFALQPGKRAEAPADITPLLVAFAGPRRYQPFARPRPAGQPDEATIHDGLNRLVETLATASR